jgi:hypothetical protein
LARSTANGEPSDEPTGALAVTSDGEQARTAPAIVVESTTGALGALTMTSGKEPTGAVLGCAEGSVLLAAACGQEPIWVASSKPRGGPVALLAVACGTSQQGQQHQDVGSRWRRWQQPGAQGHQGQRHQH